MSVAQGSDSGIDELLSSIKRIIVDEEMSSSADVPEKKTHYAPATNRKDREFSSVAGDMPVSANNGVPVNGVRHEHMFREKVGFPSSFGKQIVEQDKVNNDATDAISPLLSPDTGRAIAASFNSLSKRSYQSNGQTVDDLVREVLRPMLRDWLNENLPHLVERLVRDELARVTKGG